MKKFVGVAIAVCLVLLLYFLYENRTVTYKNEEFGFSFSYSNMFKEIYNEDTLISLAKNNGAIIISAVAKSNTTGYSKSIEELGIGYLNLLRIFHEGTKYELISDETISVSNGKVEARRAVIRSNTEKGAQVEDVILIPVEGREITISIIGTEKAIQKNEKQIDKIVKSIKID